MSDKHIGMHFNPNDKSKGNPCILEFPVNRPTASNLESFHLFKHPEKNDFRLAGENENVIFESRSKLGNDDKLGKYVVGYYCGKKRTLTFAEACYFPMNQKMRELEQNKISMSLNAGNYMDNKTLLVQDFGTNKSRKVIESMKSNIVKEANISSANAMQNIIFEKNAKEEDAIGQLASEHEKQEESMRAILPEFNSKSAKIDEIFNVDSSKQYKLILQYISCS